MGAYGAMKRLFFAVLVSSFVGLVSGALALPARISSSTLRPLLVPHRAVYDLQLANKTHAVSVSDVEGRMVFELTGSACAGYTQRMRMITRIVDAQGKSTLLDARSKTFERGDGRTFRFSARQYSNHELQEDVSGTARREEATHRVSAEIEKPDRVKLDLPGDVLFPTQHSLALQRAAKAGQHHLDVRVYDGSEQGQGFYRSFSYIGHKRPPLIHANTGKGEAGLSRNSAKLAALGLSGLASWPVAVSYFKITQGAHDVLPVYELSFRLFANGVSSDMLMNYGLFSVHGRLEQITYLPFVPCKRP